MNSFIKNIFLALAGVLVAGILYLILFGTKDLNGNPLMSIGSGTGGNTVFTFVNEWDGAVVYMARAMETPVARYYYDYCFLPSIYNDIAIDAQLGCSINGQLGNITIYLEGVDAELVNEVVGLPANAYSTGWW